MRNGKDPYAILGIPATASKDEVKEAYREMVKKFNPENFTDNPLSALAEEKMADINEAYDEIMGASNSYTYDNNTGTYSSSGTYSNDDNNYQGSYTNYNDNNYNGNYNRQPQMNRPNNINICNEGYAQRQQDYGYNNYRYNNSQSCCGFSPCDLLLTLCCMDTCCECCGGDCCTCC